MGTLGTLAIVASIQSILGPLESILDLVTPCLIRYAPAARRAQAT